MNSLKLLQPYPIFYFFKPYLFTKCAKMAQNIQRKQERQYINNPIIENRPIFLNLTIDKYKLEQRMDKQKERHLLNNEGTKNKDRLSEEFVYNPDYEKHIGKRTGNYFGRTNPKQNFDGFPRFSQYQSHRNTDSSSLARELEDKTSLSSLHPNSTLQPQTLEVKSEPIQPFTAKQSPIIAPIDSNPTSRVPEAVLPGFGEFVISSIKRRTSSARPSQIKSYRDLLSQLETDEFKQFIFNQDEIDRISQSAQKQKLMDQAEKVNREDESKSKDIMKKKKKQARVSFKDNPVEFNLSSNEKKVNYRRQDEKIRQQQRQRDREKQKEREREMQRERQRQLQRQQERKRQKEKQKEKQIQMQRQRKRQRQRQKQILIQKQKQKKRQLQKEKQKKQQQQKRQRERQKQRQRERRQRQRQVQRQREQQKNKLKKQKKQRADKQKKETQRRQDQLRSNSMGRYYQSANQPQQQYNPDQQYNSGTNRTNREEKLMRKIKNQPKDEDEYSKKTDEADNDSKKQNIAEKKGRRNKKPVRITDDPKREQQKSPDEKKKTRNPSKRKKGKKENNDKDEQIKNHGTKVRTSSKQKQFLQNLTDPNERQSQRYPKRIRVKPVQYWQNEKVSYREGMLIGIQRAQTFSLRQLLNTGDSYQHIINVNFHTHDIEVKIIVPGKKSLVSSGINQPFQTLEITVDEKYRQMQFSVFFQDGTRSQQIQSDTKLQVLPSTYFQIQNKGKFSVGLLMKLKAKFKS